MSLSLDDRIKKVESFDDLENIEDGEWVEFASGSIGLKYNLSDIDSSIPPGGIQVIKKRGERYIEVQEFLKGHLISRPWFYKVWTEEYQKCSEILEKYSLNKK